MIRAARFRFPHFPHLSLLAAAVVVAHPTPGQPGTDLAIGLPITRNYVLEDIGDVSRGVRLDFDHVGRLAVIGGDAYIVLNDTAWIDLASKDEDAQAMSQVSTDAAGRSYFSSLAAWGVVERAPDGTLRPRNVRPASYPDWAVQTSFIHILPHEDGVYFGGLNGVVHWNRTTDEQSFFKISGVTNVFSLGSRVFVSSHAGGIQSIDLARRSMETITDGELSTTVVEHAIDLTEDLALVATFDGRLLVFDGETLVPWIETFGGEPPARISGLQRLADGGIAVAVDGRGLFFLSDQGSIQLSLTTPEYHRIYDLAARENGVLWISTETSVQKLLYGNPVRIVDRRLGVPIAWPQVAQWNDRTLIISSGNLYEEKLSEDGLSIRFELVPGLPQPGAWSIAATGSQMLVGNRNGVYTRLEDRFEQVLMGIDVSNLVMVSPELCYALGTTEIAVLGWKDGRWSECAPRVPGVGFPAVVHATKSAAWIELGANRVARVSLDNGYLETRVIDDFPWSEPRWINIGVIDGTVVLSGGVAGRLFFDDKTESFRDAPELQEFLESAPLRIFRMKKDSNGVLWASHEKGVMAASLDTRGETFAQSGVSFENIVSAFQPNIQITGNDDVWISTGKALYHVSRNSPGLSPPPPNPFLVSVTDKITGMEIHSVSDPSTQIPKLPYSQNNLSFRFFSGGYSHYRPPVYEFTMTGRSNSWTTRSTDSLLVLHDLVEGTYRLSAKLINSPARETEPVIVDFSIAPPWHRSHLAYAGYGIAATLGGCGLFFWAIRRTRRRNAILEKLVRERTEELRSTMVRLNKEAGNAATLAERNRLAGEIHDSVQQGLSGLMLQLDATLKRQNLAPDVRSRLTVARNMVSFTRQEVQQAVWDLESPLLENADLAEGLKRMAALISSGALKVAITATGTSAEVPSSTKHHLLRIAQEAITNAVRHGNAEKIEVRLHCSHQSVSLEISDDGCGFVPEEVFASGIGHFGLRGLRGRVSKINANLKVISAPNNGTNVKVVVPLTSGASPTQSNGNSTPA